MSPNFKPNISPRSLMIAKKLDKSLRSPRSKKMPREEEELKKCTFQPWLSPTTKNITQSNKKTVFKRLTSPQAPSKSPPVLPAPTDTLNPPSRKLKKAPKSHKRLPFSTLPLFTSLEAPKSTQNLAKSPKNVMKKVTKPAKSQKIPKAASKRPKMKLQIDEEKTQEIDKSKIPKTTPL